ncbi:FtsW/RodA/SpoVE family cell cycle protein [Paenibacillus allorhizosphaerae]|uniref:Peptidoglycan glycosyltransferase FtsW n=1 Tax=Paenibacillus allorhizosphaerae TaxID=2849866 RepID=A0ABM8VRK8_9BACL|nr:FtsW/RodA/SpoVE family cell cycle protein [Paenibacillus allorhizosphaerae]CAG7655321.1 putative peptidoglycan glycosyltransferase FtsW [Paenibacillus allorhizosphaerae]
MLHKFKKIDVLIIAILIALLAISTILLYSATLDSNLLKFDPKKLAVIYSISFLVFIITAALDYRFLVKIAYYLYGVGILLLVGVYLFGAKINGARGWFELPFGLNFQPVELVKILLIITIAAYMARRKGESLEFFRDVVPIALFAIIPIVLVIIQPDLGNAIILGVILIGMYWIGNIRAMYVIGGVVLIAGCAYAFLYFFQLYHVPLEKYLDSKDLPTHWIARVNTFINPDDATNDQKYQVVNSIRAIGSGLLMGEGYLKGTSIHSHFIPVAYTDAIFVVVGEEFGFVGASCLLLLYFVLIYRMILISIYCNNYAGSFIIIGVVSMLVFQIFQNIGMMIGIMPLTGITLPFISYGGTSLMINMIAMGLVMSVRLHDDKFLDEE